MITPLSGGTGTVRATVRSGVRPGAESSTPVPVPLSPTDPQFLASRLALPHLEMAAHPAVVPLARHHARQLLFDLGLKELIEPVELVVSELVTNGVRASGGLDEQQDIGAWPPVVRLWLVPEQNGLLALVWDGNPALPEPKEPGIEDDSGRGLLLVDMLSEAWGSFVIPNQPGKVVWALCAAP